MRVRTIKDQKEGTSSKFNMVALSEVTVGFDDGFQETMNTSDLEVWTSTKNWQPMSEAFKNRDIITDNMNSQFFEPANAEERLQGYRYP